MSAFRIIFNCFKFQAFIFDISKSRPEEPDFFCFSKIALYSITFVLATSGLATTCKISQPSTTLSSQTIKAGSHGFENFTFWLA